MIWRTFMKFEAADYSERGIQNFDAFLNDGELYEWYLQGKYRMLVAMDGERVIGEISVRSGNFISLLFVEEDYHRLGIGRELIRQMGKYLKHQRKESYMTVNAAPYAVEFYHKLGFWDLAPQQEKQGIIYTSMKKNLKYQW